MKEGRTKKARQRLPKEKEKSSLGRIRFREERVVYEVSGGKKSDLAKKSIFAFTFGKKRDLLMGS